MDHASLRWLYLQTKSSDQVAHWLETLAEYKYTIEHRAGPRHGNVDGLSRQTCSECKQGQRIKKRNGGPSEFEQSQDRDGKEDSSCTLGMNLNGGGEIFLETRPKYWHWRCG